MLHRGLVEGELLAATGVQREETESPEDYRIRLIVAIDENLPQCWEDLSSYTQMYYNDCVKRLWDGDSIPDFPQHIDDIQGDDMSTPTETVATNNEKTTKAKTAKADAPKPKAKKKETDAFGLRVGTLSHQAAMMFVAGAKMAEVKKATGINHYNLLSKLEAKGHKVDRNDGIIKLTAKDES